MNTVPKSSSIIAMHRRYEEAMAKYSLAEKAENAVRKSKDPREERRACSLQAAMKALYQETDLLRVVILRQVPDDWADALVLQFHIVNMSDMHVNCDGQSPDGEREALQMAIDALFDFMCCEVKQDHEPLGRCFKYGAKRAYHQRRYRTGLVED